MRAVIASLCCLLALAGHAKAQDYVMVAVEIGTEPAGQDNPKTVLTGPFTLVRTYGTSAQCTTHLNAATSQATAYWASPFVGSVLGGCYPIAPTGVAEAETMTILAVPEYYAGPVSLSFGVYSSSLCTSYLPTIKTALQPLLTTDGGSFTASGCL